MPCDPSVEAELTAVDFADLAGWRADDHAAAFAAFRRSAQRMAVEPPRDGSLGVRGEDLRRIGKAALCEPDPMDKARARVFFETHFRPYAVRPRNAKAFLTGYYEPEIAGALTPDATFQVPLFARPGDLVAIDDSSRPPEMDAIYQFARSTPQGLRPYHDRGEIEDGALAGRGLELVYVADPVDAFFIHVQGSASIRLRDGARLRLAYAAKAGHPYTSIGKRLIEAGLATPETMTLEHLKAWLTENRQAGRELMRQNRSYVFFQTLGVDLDPKLGAVAAAGVQITPGRSLAVDHRLHAYGTPIWLEATLPLGPAGGWQAFNRLMIAQDTGSAIVGPARGDIFIGLGPDAGAIAGRIRHVPDAFVMLKPIETD